MQTLEHAFAHCTRPNSPRNEKPKCALKKHRNVLVKHRLEEEHSQCPTTLLSLQQQNLKNKTMIILLQQQQTIIQLEEQDDDDTSTTTINCLDLLQQKELRPMNSWNMFLCQDYYCNQQQQQQQDLEGQAKEDERAREIAMKMDKNLQQQFSTRNIQTNNQTTWI